MRMWDREGKATSHRNVLWIIPSEQWGNWATYTPMPISHWLGAAPRAVLISGLFWPAPHMSKAVLWGLRQRKVELGVKLAALQWSEGMTGVSTEAAAGKEFWSYNDMDPQSI